MSYTKPLLCPIHNIDRVYKTASYRPSGKALICPECDKEQRKKFRTRPDIKSYDKKHHMKQYGLTIEAYNSLLAKQGGRCAICHEFETATNQYGIKSLAVDHDHATGQVRGLLCSNCNQLIGRAKDNLGVLESAANYIRTNRTV